MDLFDGTVAVRRQTVDCNRLLSNRSIRLWNDRRWEAVPLPGG
jgi:hypothetical protein